MTKSNALIILTEWNEFRALYTKVKNFYRPIIVDFRNIYNPDALLKQGMEYYSIGRPINYNYKFHSNILREYDIRGVIDEI